MYESRGVKKVVKSSIYNHGISCEFRVIKCDRMTGL